MTPNAFRPINQASFADIKVRERDDVQQIIPLPEANEYQIQLREKEQIGRKSRAGVSGYRSPESEWPAIQSEMVDSMVKLETALKPGFAALGG